MDSPILNWAGYLDELEVMWGWEGCVVAQSVVGGVSSRGESNEG